MRFGSFMRGDTVHRHPELIELAARAGLSFCLMGIETLDPAWLKNHRKGVRTEDAVAFYGNVYAILRRNRVFVLGLFITPPEAEPGQVSGRGADGVVCDAHYTADLVAQKGSALYENLNRSGAVAKDMFYHDWNLPSIMLAEGRTQTSRKSVRALLRAWNGHAVRTAFVGHPLSRRFRWRNLGVLAERLVCTTRDDIRRYRCAKDASLPVAERQRRIVASAAEDGQVRRLAQARWLTSPLSLRNGVWSAQPVTTSDADPAVSDAVRASPRHPPSTGLA